MEEWNRGEKGRIWENHLDYWEVVEGVIFFVKMKLLSISGTGMRGRLVVDQWLAWSSTSMGGWLSEISRESLASSSFGIRLGEKELSLEGESSRSCSITFSRSTWGSPRTTSTSTGSTPKMASFSWAIEGIPWRFSWFSCSVKRAVILSLVKFREASSDSLQLMRIEGSTSELTSLRDNGLRRGWGDIFSNLIQQQRSKGATKKEKVFR